MAKFNPPTNFSFDKPAEWPDWKQRFVRFRTATKPDKEDGAVQVSSLIYAMGSESENVFRSFTFAEEGDEEDNFGVVLAKFDEYFVPRRNVIHERACFHQRLQRPGEKAETFIRALYELQTIVISVRVGRRIFATESLLEYLTKTSRENFS